jgi:hypothetical protein
MNEHRRKILEMLAQGQITADEAERLMNAIEKEPAGPPPGNGAEAPPRPKPKYLRVLVEERKNGAEGDPSLVNIRVPMQLLRAGVKLAGLIPLQAREHVNDALRQHGVPFDVTQIRPENLEEIVDQLGELTIDVDQKHDNVKVRVYCE